MKKLIFGTILSILTVTGFAAGKINRKDDAGKISYNVKRQFDQEFEDAKEISWIINDEFQKATFTVDGNKFTALYDLQENYLGATKFISYKDVPAKAKAEIERKFKDYYFSEGIQVVSRPSGDYDSNDVGTYWLDMVKEGKKVYLKVSPFSVVEVYKTIDLRETAKN